MEQSQDVTSLVGDRPSLDSLPDSQFQNWQKILALIQKELSERSFETWFGGVRCVGINPQTLTLGVPDPFFGNWLREHYEDLIRSSAEEVLGSRPGVRYQAVALPQVTAPAAQRIARDRLEARELGLNPNYSFENFIVGPGNRFAHAAALAVTEDPAKHYNPLFIYGRVGLGKTHLLQAVALETKRRYPEKKILYLPSERFTNELIAAIQSRSTQNFRARFRHPDLLLIDDIHFVAGKESTQEELFHTFNTLYDAHKQIVISSDRPPREIPRLEERLISRFGWGLVTDIQPPDLETRIAILRKKLEREAIRVPDDVLFLIAERIQSNIRELEGALIRVVAYASLAGGELNVDFVQRVLGSSFCEEGQKTSIEEVQQRVAEFFGLRVADLRAKRRTRRVARARQVAMYLVRELTHSSFVEIGEYFGGRDHTTVLHACREILRQLNTNQQVKDTISSLRKGFNL